MRAHGRIAGAAALVLVLVGCAPAAEPQPTAAPSSSAAPSSTAEPSSTAVPVPSPSASTPAPPPVASSADPHADWQRIATPNGTATFAIPPGWSAVLDGEELEYDGEAHWRNHIEVRDESGSVQLNYVDGPGGEEVGPVMTVSVVAGERVETLDDAERATVVDDVFDPAYLDHAAVAWWSDWGERGISAVVSLTTARSLAGDEQPGFVVQDSVRGVSFVTQRFFGSEAEAESWLAGDEAARLIEIIATLDLTAVPAPALP